MAKVKCHYLPFIAGTGNSTKFIRSCIPLVSSSTNKLTSATQQYTEVTHQTSQSLSHTIRNLSTNSRLFYIFQDSKTRFQALCDLDYWPSVKQHSRHMTFDTINILTKFDVPTAFPIVAKPNLLEWPRITISNGASYVSSTYWNGRGTLLQRLLRCIICLN